MNETNRGMASPRDRGRPAFDAQDDGPFVPEDLVRWVHEQIARGCLQITLRQRADEGEIMVCILPLAGDDDAQAIASTLYLRATGEGRYNRSPSLFVLYAFRDIMREHCDRKTFRVEGESFSRSGETEPPTATGLNAMLMRHSEAATKVALGHTSHIIEQYKVLLSQRDRRISELETQLRDASAMRESLVMLEHERAQAMHRAKMDEKRSDFMRDKLDLLLPVVAGKMLGTTQMGVPPVVTDETMKQLLGSLTPEQLVGLQGILRPEQQTVVADLYVRYAQRSKDPDVAAAANGTSNGAAPSR